MDATTVSALERLGQDDTFPKLLARNARTSVDVINQRILGRYQNGLGKTWDDPNHMKFYNDGAVTFPYLSDGMWFMTQHRRWGLLKEDPDYSGRDGVYFYLAESLMKIKANAQALPYYEKLVKEFSSSEYVEEAKKRIATLKPIVEASGQ